MVTVALAQDDQNPYPIGLARVENEGDIYGYPVNDKTLTDLGAVKPQSRAEKIRFLENHERHYGDGYGYQPKTYANNIKLGSQRLPKPLDFADYYESLEYFWEFTGRDYVDDFEDYHGVKIWQGGRSGGYLTMWRGNTAMGNYELDYETEYYTNLYQPYHDWKQKFDDAFNYAIRNEWSKIQDEVNAAYEPEFRSIMASDEALEIRLRQTRELENRYRYIREQRYELWELEWKKTYKLNTPPPTVLYRSELSSWSDEDIDREFDLVWAFDVFTHNFICEFVYQAFWNSLRDVLDWLGSEKVEVKQVNDEKGFPDRREIWLPYEWAIKDDYENEEQRHSELAQRAGILKFVERDETGDWEIYALTEKYDALLTQI